MSGSPQPTAVLLIAARGEMDGIRRRQHSLPSSSPITTTCSPTPSSHSLICCSLTFYILPLNPSLITRWVHREAISQRLDYRLSPCGVISSPPPLHLHPDSALTPSTVLASVYTVCNYCLYKQCVSLHVTASVSVCLSTVIVTPTCRQDLNPRRQPQQLLDPTHRRRLSTCHKTVCSRTI